MNMTCSSAYGAAAAAAGDPHGGEPTGQTHSLVSGMFGSLRLHVHHY